MARRVKLTVPMQSVISKQNMTHNPVWVWASIETEPSRMDPYRIYCWYGPIREPQGVVGSLAGADRQPEGPKAEVDGAVQSLLLTSHIDLPPGSTSCV